MSLIMLCLISVLGVFGFWVLFLLAIARSLGGTPLQAISITTMLDQLREHDGDCIQIYADDVWSRTLDGPCRVVCSGQWTGWEPRSYRGADLHQALRRAHAARYPTKAPQ